jgi:nucleoside-diphosphate-sugar epimerase
MKTFTILGAGGSIGNALVRELLAKGRNVHLVSRSGYSWPGAKSVKGDLSNMAETIDAVKGSSVVFLCAGLPYDHKVWAKTWFYVMSNTIEACKRANARLIFFDNVYMYGLVTGKMTEKTPYYPCSKKGEIRAEIARFLFQEIKNGAIHASIARAADIYGPYATVNSIPFLLVFQRLLKRQKAQWLVNKNALHSFTFTTDAAKAMILLADSERSDQQIWHLPTSNPGITGENFMELASKEFGMKPNYQVLPKWMLRVGGHFDKKIQETYEMLYQYEFDYQFDSTKFEQFFKFEPTSYPLGIAETVSFLKSGE